MAFAVITEEGRAELHPGDPEGLTIGRIVKGVPSLVATRSRDVVLWVNDNFQSQEQAGELARNTVGTVFAISSGAAPVPYAGPIVVTGIHRDPLDGWSPAALTAEDEFVTLGVVNDIRHVLYGEGEPVEPALLDDEVCSMMRLAAEVAEAPYPPLQVEQMSVEEFLRRIGG